MPLKEMELNEEPITDRKPIKMGAPIKSESLSQRASDTSHVPMRH